MMQVLIDIQKMVQGRKTHLTLWFGFSVVILGYLIGGFDVGVIHVPAYTTEDVWKYLWEAVAGSSLRAGVSKIQPPAIKALFWAVVAAGTLLVGQGMAQAQAPPVVVPVTVGATKTITGFTPVWFPIQKPDVSIGWIKGISSNANGQTTFFNYPIMDLTYTRIDPATNLAVQISAFAWGMSVGVTPLGGSDANTSLGIPAGLFVRAMKMLYLNGGYIICPASGGCTSTGGRPWFVGPTLDAGRLADMGWQAVTGTP